MIRRLQKADIEVILSPDFNFKDAWNKSMLEGAFDGDNFLALGFFVEGELVGYGAVTLGYDDADLQEIAVKQSFRKRKIATTLLSALEEQTAKEDKSKIFLEVRKGNLPAINLYKKFGYKEISQRKKYYNDGEDALVMVKEL